MRPLLIAIISGALCFIVGFVGATFLAMPDSEDAKSAIAAAEDKIKQLQENLKENIRQTNAETTRLAGELKKAKAEIRHLISQLREAKAEISKFKQDKPKVPTNAKKVPISNPLKFQVVTTKTYGQEMIGIQVKITNISNHHINGCEATCILKDAIDKDLAFERHYVIKSIDGGLAPGKFTYFEYVIDCKPDLVKKALFHIENLY